MNEKKKITIDVGRNIRKVVSDVTCTLYALGQHHIDAQSNATTSLVGIFQGWIDLLDTMHSRDSRHRSPALPRYGETFADYTGRRIRSELEQAEVPPAAVWTKVGWREAAGGGCCDN